MRYFSGRLQGDRAALIARTGLTKGRVTQLLDDNEPFGERAASSLARKLGLPPDFFERDEESAAAAAPGVTVRSGAKAARLATAEELEVLRLWEPLLDEQKADVLARLNQAHTHALKTIAEVQRRGYASTVAEDALPPQFTRPAQRDLLPEPAAVKRKGKR